MARTLLSGATVLDGTGAEPARADVVLDGDRILDVGTGLDGDEQVDLAGRWLLPGFIDCHVHVMASTINVLRFVNTPFSLNFFLAARNLEHTLQAGITTVRDAGGADLGVKTAVEQGLITGPRMQISITILSQTGGHGDDWMICGAGVPHLFVSHPGLPDRVCDGAEGVLRKTREVIRAGADVVKVCATGGVLSAHDHPEASQFLPDELAVIVAEAAASERAVMAHAQGAAGVKNALRAGVRSIEHGIFLDDEAIEMMLEAGAYLVPTLIAPLGVLDAPEGVPESSLAKAREVVEIHRESIKRAVAAGVRVAMGTDAGVVPHGSNLRELTELVGAGMTPAAAIEASTRVAAACLGMDDHVGTIEPGKVADLVIVGDDPLAAIETLAESVVSVWQAGRPVHTVEEDR